MDEIWQRVLAELDTIPILDGFRAPKAPAQTNRRGFLISLTGFVAAPYVIRNAGSLMPVRDRTVKPMFDSYGFRDYETYPPTVAEVRDWRDGLEQMFDQGIIMNWSAQGMQDIYFLGQAEDRYRAAGLL